jgi:hypothetical protein
VEHQKACELTLGEGLDLKQVYQDDDRSNNSVKRGIARRFISHIKTWFEQYSCDGDVDLSVEQYTTPSIMRWEL